MVIKTSGLADTLRAVLTDDRINCAFVFGSVARGDEKAGSDVGLMVIGDLGLRELSSILSGIQEVIGREINPHVMSKREFRRRVKSKEHFISSVLREPKIFIVGSDRDLATMGG